MSIVLCLVANNREGLEKIVSPLNICLYGTFGWKLSNHAWKLTINNSTKMHSKHKQWRSHIGAKGAVAPLIFLKIFFILEY
jgi:hypothetical protein